MNRRSFLTAAAAAIGALALDPERALWLPGRKLISIPKPAPVFETFAIHGISGVLKVGDIFTISGVYVPNPPKREVDSPIVLQKFKIVSTEGHLIQVA